MRASEIRNSLVSTSSTPHNPRHVILHLADFALRTTTLAPLLRCGEFAVHAAGRDGEEVIRVDGKDLDDIAGALDKYAGGIRGEADNVGFDDARELAGAIPDAGGAIV